MVIYLAGAQGLVGTGRGQSICYWLQWKLGRSLQSSWRSQVDFCLGLHCLTPRPSSGVT